MDSPREDGRRIDVSARELIGIGRTAEVAATVECALATALARAAEAGQWNVVVQLARDLEARRLADQELVAVEGSSATRIGEPNESGNRGKGRS
jgi:hypothetical protein